MSRPRRACGLLIAIAAVSTAAGCQAGASTSAAGSNTSIAPPGTSSVTTQAPSRGSPPSQPRQTASTAASDGDVLLDGGAVVLPNGSRTPGAVNPAVTQATISRTICRTGYTRTIRPPSDYTTGLKEQQLASGYAFRGDTSTRDYEEDHLISLELGGAPRDTRNLWPEPYLATDGARVKDRVENELHDLVCSGRLSLSTAQQAIARNWWSAYQRYGGEGAPTVWGGSYSGSSSTTSGSAAATTSSQSTATARCNDGTYSYSQHRSGTCSRHGGVAYWINPPPS